MFCGSPGTGIHATHIFGFAFWDIVATIAATMMLNYWVFHTKSFLPTFFILVLIGIGVHKTLGIKTKLNSLLFK
jgi:hypothetical protein